MTSFNCVGFRHSLRFLRSPGHVPLPYGFCILVYEDVHWPVRSSLLMVYACIVGLAASHPSYSPEGSSGNALRSASASAHLAIMVTGFVRHYAVRHLLSGRLVVASLTYPL